MNPILLALIFSALLPWQSTFAQKQADTPVSNQGKIIFTGQCGSCHDADANKKLPDGTTLLARLAKNKAPETRLGTRLKNEQERRQVFLYLHKNTLMPGASGATAPGSGPPA